MKYADWLKKWLDLYVKPTVKIRTYEKYTQVCRVHIIPALGSIEIDELSAVCLQEFVVGLSAKLSANSVNLIITVLQKSLNMALIVGVCNTQHANKIVRPKAEEKKVECFSGQEQKKIENYVLNNGKDKLFGIVLCLYAGLRIGELLALTWNDIDFGKGLLFVSKTCHDGNDGINHIRIIDSPKTVHSRRVIPLPKQILSLLKGIKKHSKCEYRSRRRQACVCALVSTNF